MPTYTTIPFLILLALMWRWTRGNTVAIVAFMSIFDAASVLNIGALGIAPWLLALVICLPIQLLQKRVRSRIAARTVNRLGLNLLLAFLMFAVLSGLAFPAVFKGVPVMQLMAQVPLSWGLPNLAQLCYLAAATVVFFLTLTGTPEEIASGIRWYIRGSITAALIAIYQLASVTIHVPFPRAILYSNTAHVIYNAYQINGMWRLNSTFTEASDMAGSLIPALAMLCWDWAMKPHRWKRTFSVALLFVSILMTLSTTGYLCIALLAAAAVPTWFWQFVVRKKNEAPKLVIIVLCLTAVGTTFITSGKVRGAAKKVADSVVLQKMETASYKARTESHAVALETLKATDYLGAGWGSTRASGLVYTLLAAIGVPGTLLFGLACAAILVPIAAGMRSILPDLSAGRIALAIVLMLMAMVLAGSEPIAPALWIFFAAALRVRKVQRNKRPVRFFRDELAPLSSDHSLSAVPLNH